jgi:hypothetical protein
MLAAWALLRLKREEVLTSAIMAFGFAVGGVSLICSALMTRTALAEATNIARPEPGRSRFSPLPQVF